MAPLGLIPKYKSCHNRKCDTDSLSSDINLIGLINKRGKFLRWEWAEIKHRMYVDVSGAANCWVPGRFIPLRGLKKDVNWENANHS
jgi:hypothetical protein